MGCSFGVLDRRIGTDCFERRVIFDCKGGEREGGRDIKLLDSPRGRE